MLDEILKRDKAIMKLLKLDSISHNLAETTKGTLRLVARNYQDFHSLTLDAVPLEKEKNDELLELLYPTKTAPDYVEKKDLYPNLADINVRFGLIEKKLDASIKTINLPPVGCNGLVI